MRASQLLVNWADYEGRLVELIASCETAHIAAASRNFLFWCCHAGLIDCLRVQFKRN